MFSTQEIKQEAQAFLSDGIELVRKEVQLAKAELNEKVNQAQNGMLSLIAGALVGTAGLIFLGHAALAYLSTITSPIVAALIVSVVFLVISAFMLISGKSKLSSQGLKPQRTLEAAQNIANEFGGKSNV